MKRACCGILLTVWLTCLSAGAAAEEEFSSIFDGRSLDGWVGQDMSFWSVEDGAITGTITPEHSPKLNQYLVWQGGLVDDFELRLKFRLTGSTTPNTNGGFQFRSRLLPNGDVAGYQVDNNFGQPWKARLYDEFGRHDLALEGERAVFDAEGRRTVESLGLKPADVDFQLDDWHEYHLTARGPVLTLKVNEKLIAEVIDNDRDSFEPVGILAMQLHTGPPMKAQFKDIRLKRLTPENPISPRNELLAGAALHWQLGKRLDAHQPPLKAVGKIVPGVDAEGLGATSGAKVARFEQAYFDVEKDLNQPKLWNAPNAAVTVYLRARVPTGNWTSALFAKRGDHYRVNFNLYSVDLAESPGPDIGFEVTTDAAFYSASFPVSKVNAGAWHDLVGRYDGQTLQVLCDGVVMVEMPASGKLIQNEELILIGAETDNGPPSRFFTGEMETAAVWTRALSNDELKLLLRPVEAANQQ